VNQGYERVFFLTVYQEGLARAPEGAGQITDQGGPREPRPDHYGPGLAAHALSSEHRSGYSLAGRRLLVGFAHGREYIRGRGAFSGVALQSPPLNVDCTNRRPQGRRPEGCQERGTNPFRV
jgi:hypothetical protein